MQFHTPKPSNEAHDITINASNILEIIENTDPSSVVFTEAIAYLKSKSILNNSIIPLREIVQLNTLHDRKIIHWLSQQTFLSRARNNSTDSRGRIAFNAWLLGSPNGTLFAKTEGEYNFVGYIKNILQGWSTKNADEKELVTTIIKMMLNLIINNMEIRLPNTSSHDELKSIYQAALKLITYVQDTYRPLQVECEYGRKNDLNHDILASYGEEDILGREMIFFRASFIDIYLVQFYGWTPRNALECLRAITEIDTHLIAIGSTEDLRNVYKTTYNFRLNRGKAIAELDIWAEKKEAALNVMIEYFYDFYYKRLYHNMLDARPDEASRKDLEKAIKKAIGPLSVKKFIDDISTYHPHKSTDFMVNIAAHQAELDTFTHTFKVLPDDALNLEKLGTLLGNILGSQSEQITYHPMDNCQGYVLAIIDEILRRLCVSQLEFTTQDVKEIQKFKIFIGRLESYLTWLPHHPMHVNLSGSIHIRMANLYARFPELGKSMTEAELFFIKGYKLFFSEWNDKQRMQCIENAHIFLKKYLEEFDKNLALETNTTIDRSPMAHPPRPYWEARIGLSIVLKSYHYQNYENVIARKISDGIDQMIIEMELEERTQQSNVKKWDLELEFAKSKHQNIGKLLDSISKIIMFAYDGIFDVSIARANQHKPRLGDFYISDEIAIGFGYTAQIEYPLENVGLIERDFIPGKRSSEEIQKLFSGVVGRHLREYIVRISDQKVLAQFLSPEEKASQKLQHKDVSGFIDMSKYALYHEIFNVKNIKDINPLIFHQKKYKNEQLNGSEILVRFENPNPNAEELLPLPEVFAFVDLFEQYKVVSRRILEKAIEESITLGHPFSLNIKCEELTDVDFSDFLISRIKKAGLSSGENITLEILESSALDPEDGHVIKNLKALKIHGFHFALDDFRGTDEDYDKFNILRAIHIPIEFKVDFEKPGAKDFKYFTVENQKQNEYVESNFMSVEEEPVPEALTMPIFGSGDEVKFDYTNKETLKQIHDITANWPESKITLKNIHLECKDDVTSPIHRLVNLISYCKHHHIKYTIEQIRDRGDGHLLRIANLLGFVVQGYCYHIPSPVNKSIDFDAIGWRIKKKVGVHVDFVL